MNDWIFTYIEVLYMFSAAVQNVFKINSSTAISVLCWLKTTKQPSDMFVLR